jgi:hypothetical protein
VTLRIAETSVVFIILQGEPGRQGFDCVARACLTFREETNPADRQRRHCVVGPDRLFCGSPLRRFRFVPATSKMVSSGFQKLLTSRRESPARIERTRTQSRSLLRNRSELRRTMVSCLAGKDLAFAIGRFGPLAIQNRDGSRRALLFVGSQHENLRLASRHSARQRRREPGVRLPGKTLD